MQISRITSKVTNMDLYIWLTTFNQLTITIYFPVSSLQNDASGSNKFTFLRLYKIIFQIIFWKVWKIAKRKKKAKKDKTYFNITISQGREALVGSLFLCESALHATKPPNPAPRVKSTNKQISLPRHFNKGWGECNKGKGLRYTNGYNSSIWATAKHHILQSDNNFRNIIINLQNQIWEIKWIKNRY